MNHDTCLDYPNSQSHPKESTRFRSLCPGFHSFLLPNRPDHAEIQQQIAELRWQITEPWWQIAVAKWQFEIKQTEKYEYFWEKCCILVRLEYVYRKVQLKRCTGVVCQKHQLKAKNNRTKQIRKRANHGHEARKGRRIGERWPKKSAEQLTKQVNDQGELDYSSEGLRSC